jgi:hypothetical protein
MVQTVIPPVNCLPSEDSEGAAPIHLLFHVPRCSGRTIDLHISEYASKENYYRSRKRKGPRRFFLPRYDLTDMPDTQGLKAIGGHYIGKSIERLFAGRSIRRSILLRDPVSHILSYYNFRMMRYISQGLKTYRFELAYKARQRNFLTHFILGNFLEIPWPRLILLSETEKYALANTFLASCWFVGDYTRCGELIAALAPDLGVPNTATPRNTQRQWQACVQWNSLRVEDLSSRMVDQIRRDNALDELLWESWRETGRDVSRVQPREIYQKSHTELRASEWLRPVYQVERRFRRGWNIPRGSAAPSSSPSLQPRYQS